MLQKSEPDSALYFTKIYIAKAKRENDFHQLFSGYDYAMKFAAVEQQIKYGDSMITTAVKLKDNDEIGEAFIALGQTYMVNDQYKDALEQTLSGYEYFKINNNPYLLYTAKRNIAIIKAYIEDFYDAQQLNKECVDFFREHKERIKDTDYAIYYIHSLIALINTSTYLQDFKDNPKLIEEGIDFVKNNIKYAEYLPYFISSQGLDAYFRGDYGNAIQFFNRSLSSYQDKWKHLTDQFYLGMSYRKTGQWEKAMPYFKNLEKDYDETKKLDPEFRPTFEAFIEYYTQKGDKKMQAIYIDKLLAFDEQAKENKTFLISKIKKEYDTNELLAYKKKIEHGKLFERSGLAFLLVSCGASLLYVRHKKRKRIARKAKVEALSIPNQVSENIANNSSQIKTETRDYELYKPINKETVQSLLVKLQDFEDQKNFTKKGLKLYDLAKEFGTNEKYLSKVISVSKNKNFNNYLTDLRLDYFQELIGNNIENSTIKILSEKIGFESYSQFFKSYKERYNTVPSSETKEF
ncbi:tetratricopeptide repeat protein [Kaistella sp.]|uniref:tetratricopeptide repeat protein n=1 Tax=Kaistella sp. TaxID=2782235 RepID=UPI003C3F1EEB